MSMLVKKVIRASAGTGKTFRLSLEYIALLLRCRSEGIQFGEILVITFTKKAAAEIRERIFNHLRTLIDAENDSKTLQRHLAPLLGRSWAPGDREWLRQIYHEMLANKSQVQISTIDAFINRLFKSIISPFLGLSSYTINSRMDPRYFASLFSYALEPENLEIIKSLFERSRKRTLPDYQALIKGLLGTRWLLHFIERSGASHLPDPETAAAHLTTYQMRMNGVLDRFTSYLAQDSPAISAQKALLREYYEALFSEDDQNESWLDLLRSRLTDPGFVLENHRLLLKDLKFWSGASLLRKKQYADFAAELKAELEQAKAELADYLYHSVFLQEEVELEQIAVMLLHKYDELRLRDQIFGYDDIAWYTFKHLYDPELSLIEEDSVTNSFYEILANRVRFLLIDEFQDTSLLQFKILWPLISEVISGEGVRSYGGVIVVGDEKQSIYGWRGGERDLLPALPALLGGADKIRLDTSFRSSPLIIDLVNALFGGRELQLRLSEKGLEWPYEACQTARQESTGGLFVCFRTYSNQDEEAEFASLRDTCTELVREELQPLLLKKVIQPGSTAILARENRDLRTIADILDEFKIDYVLESSHSLLEHRAIKPLFFLLRYLATLDFQDLLRFFRSDYVLMNGSDLKEVLLAYRAVTADPSPLTQTRKLAHALPDLDAVQRCAALLEASSKLDLLNLCKRIFEDFTAMQLFPQENDSKNMAFFLELVAGFCHHQREFPPTPAGFIGYCEMHRDDEGWQQLGLEEIDAVRLLTVHKSKGLEFDTVFLFWPLTSRGSDHGGLHRYVRYDDSFHRIEAHALTYNYDAILAGSCMRELVLRGEAKECVEELNAFYVAMTRARRHLGIYMTGRGKGVDVLFESANSKERMDANSLIFCALRELLTNQGLLQQVHEDAEEARWGVWTALTDEKASEATPVALDLAAYLDPEHTRWLRTDPERSEKERFLDYRSVYLNKRRVDRGNAVHYYLSHIDFDTPAVRQRAAQRTLGDFGSLLPEEVILRLIERVESFLTGQTGYFSAAQWSRVFTEQTFYTLDGREQRIDRMLVSEERKEILIIDFKTGESREQAQLEEYIRTVSELPYVRSQGYAVRGIFLEVNVD